MLSANCESDCDANDASSVLAAQQMTAIWVHEAAERAGGADHQQRVCGVGEGGVLECLPHCQRAAGDRCRLEVRVPIGDRDAELAGEPDALGVGTDPGQRLAGHREEARPRREIGIGAGVLDDTR